MKEKKEIVLLDSIRTAIILYADDCKKRDSKISERTIASNLGTPASQYYRIIKGEGLVIRTSTLDAMLPLIGKYLDPLDLSYCKSHGFGDFVIMLSTVKDACIGDYFGQLAQWLEYEAKPADRDLFKAMAERCGFAFDREEEQEEVREVVPDRKKDHPKILGMYPGLGSVEDLIAKQKNRTKARKDLDSTLKN